MGKPTLPSLRKIGMAIWSAKVVEDVLSLFLVYLESMWSFCLTFQRFEFTMLVNTLAKQKKSSPPNHCGTVSSQEPKVETI